MPTFRIHFEDGTKRDVVAATPKEAADGADTKAHGPVKKVKLRKENA